MKQKRYEWANLTGKGDTIADAKAAVMKQAEEILTSDTMPWIYVHKNYVLLVTNQLGAWHYAIIDTSSQGYQDPCSHMCSNKDIAIRSGRSHMAQWLYDKDGESGLDVIENASDRSQHEWWVKWQDAYKTATKNGATSEDARKTADTESYR